MLVAPLPADESERLALLERLEVMDTPSDPVLDSIVRCASFALGCPIALVSLVDARRQWFKARHGLTVTETPREVAFCAHTLLTESILEIPDARNDMRFADNPLVLEAPSVVFYAGVPLAVGRHRIGSLCVLDQVPRTLTTEQRELLLSMAAAASHWFLNRHERIETATREALLHKLAVALPGFVYQFRLAPDGQSCFPFASEHIRELFEVAPESVRHDASPVFARVHPVDLPGLSASIQASARTLQPWRHEFRVQLPDRGPRWLEGSSRPEALDDGSVLWHGFVTDISQRRERDTRWQIAVDAARLGLIEVDLRRAEVDLDANARLQHGLPLVRAESALPLAAWLALFDADARDRLSQAIDALHHDGEVLDLTLALADAGAGVRHLEIVAQRVGDTDGRLVGACRDVSQQLQLEQLQRDKLAAEKASRAKGEFLSRVSHELRTPLNAILGFTQLLQIDAAHPLDATQRHRVDQVRHAGAHLLDLINDVLDLTRFEQEGRELALGAVPLGAALAAVCSMVETLAQQRSVVIERTPVPAEWAVEGDARTLEQVLVNLLSNGIKYNRVGGHLRIAVRDDAGRVEIEISDDGPGLSAAQLAQLFQPFNRLGAENAGIEGSGLGLVIAKSAVEAMGGQLGVRSTPGHGASFAVRLARAADVAPRPPDAGPAAGPAGTSVRPATVLYIEDDPVNAMLVVEALRVQPQWQVVVSVDGLQGLALARELQPDVLLIDINLPRLKGDEVVRALRRHPATRALRCIALSADALPEQIAAARAAGFDDYWTKPIDLQLLRARLVDLLSDAV